MFRNKKVLSFLIAIVFVISCFPAYAEDFSIDTETEIVSPKADINEITNPFASKTEWKAHLQEKNQELKKSDLQHDTIQGVLKERGVSGLSKRDRGTVPLSPFKKIKELKSSFIFS